MMDTLVCPQCKSNKVRFWERGTCTYLADSPMFLLDGRPLRNYADVEYDDHRPEETRIFCKQCGYLIASSIEELAQLLQQR